MKKKQKPQPVLISSREGMLAVVADLIQDKLEFQQIQLSIEQEKAAIDKKNQGALDALARRIQMNEAGLQVWSKMHPQEFDGKRSIDLPTAIFGFRLGKHKVDKPSNVTWKEIADRLISTILRPEEPEGQPIFEGEEYIRYGDAEVDKDALLRDRDLIPQEALDVVGIKFAQDDFFFFEPKSQVLEATKEAA